MTSSADNPFQPSAWSSDYFGDAAAGQGPPRLDRGLVDHVPIVSILMIIQGTLEAAFALLGFGFLALVFCGPQKELEGMRGLGIMMAGLSVPAVIASVLRIVAGVYNLRYRRRGLGLAALGIGLLTLVTGYCAPTAIALAIYGLIVYVNEPVVLAFRMGASGRTPAEIRAAFLPRI